MIKLMRRLDRSYIPSLIALVFLVFGQTLAQLYIPTLNGDIIDQGVMAGDTGYILRTGGLMLLVSMGGMLCAVFAGYIASKVSMGFGRDLRKSVFKQVTDYSLGEFESFGTSTLITRNTNDITQIQNVINIMLRLALMAPFMFIGSMFLAIRKDAKLSLVIAGVVPIMLILIFVMAKFAIPMFRSMQKKLDKLNLVMREKLIGIRVIRAFNRDESEAKRFDEANVDLTKVSIKVNRLMAIFIPIVMLLFNLVIIAVIWFGGLRIDSGEMEIGVLMAFVQYVMNIMFSMMLLAMVFIMVPRAEASAVRVEELLAVKPKMTDPENPKHSVKHGYVRFEHVTFGYPGAESPTLYDVSFDAHPGEMTAIIGSTGSGKSTVVDLIPRFHDVSEGKVLVDGVDVRDYTREELRKKISFIPQTALLFSGTVEENIRFGNEDATEEQVRHAAEVAQAAEFIDELQGGYSFPIAQGGTNLSGGQKQRLTIARGIVRNPEIYIFDDNFSALDFKTDSKLRAALKKETENSTVFIVAQRVATVIDADRIIVLDEGRVVGIGTHKELLANNEVYREIVASQFSEEELA